MYFEEDGEIPFGKTIKTKTIIFSKYEFKCVGHRNGLRENKEGRQSV